MNLAKLFKLPKKLGDSMLISLINNMVDYLRNYDNAIKVDDDGYIHLAADELYLETDGNDIDIHVNNNIYLNSDGEINLNSYGDIQLTTANNSSIVLSSDSNIDLISNSDINLTASYGNPITLQIRDGDYDRALILWADDDGLQYIQDSITFLQIDKDGEIYGKRLEKTINVKISNNVSEGLIYTITFYSENDNISESMTVSSDDYDDINIGIQYPNYNSNGYLKVSVDSGGFKGTVAINPNNENIIFGINNANLNNFIIPINFKITNEILINLDDNYCYTADTLITLADGTTKQVKDITYDDELKVWNFDEGKDDIAKPLWIKRTEYAKSYQLVTLSDGNTIKLCGSDGKYHCMFDVTEQKFNHAVDCIGHEVYTENGIATVVSIEEVKEKVDHYNIVTNYHMNLYANHILTSTEKNNIYPIADMKFVKDDREIVPYEEFEKAHISREYYDGWRAGEWSEPLKDVITHLRHRKIYAKPQKRVKDGLRTDYFG